MNFTADFETTSAKQYEIDGYTRVWGVSVRNIETEKVELLSNNIDDFMEWLSKGNKNHINKKVYFHNLAFDGTFILEWLFKNGFKHSTEKRLKEKEFRTLITSTGIWYVIEICYKRYKTRSQTAMIYDSLKKLPMSAERIAKAFKLPIMKGSIDYDAYRGLNHELTNEEIEYINNDTLILAKALKTQFDEGLDKLTIGSDALGDFKERIGGKRQFNYLFPILKHEIDADLRLSYKGGWTYLKPEYSGKELKNIVSYDVNSLYPSVMYSPHLLPIGEPIHYEGKYEEDVLYPLYIQFLRCEFKLKENHLPTIQLKNNWLFSANEYIVDSKGEEVYLALTSVDLKLFLDHYDVKNLTYLEGFKFRGITGIFDGYINHWYELKETSEGGKRELAKLMLNNLYGKFGTNPRKQNYIPDFVDGEVVYNVSEEEMGDSVYVPMASFITSYARNKTIRTAQRLHKYFVYSDTDSIHLTGITHEEVCKIIEVHPTKLGAWGYEGLSERGKFLRPKTYILEQNGKLDVKVAGLPRTARHKVTFENFKFGFETVGGLKSKRVPGGRILEEKTFHIKNN